MGERGPVRRQALMRRHDATPRREPVMPVDLSPEAVGEWQRVTALLRSRGMLDEADRAALVDYVTCWARLVECERDIATRGVLVDGERGKIKNPSCQLARQYRADLMKWSKEFGLTPSSRTRLNVSAPAKDNPFRRLHE